MEDRTISNVYFGAHFKEVKPKVVIDPFIHDQANLTRKEFIDRTQYVKAIRTTEIKLNFYFDDIQKLRRFESLHHLVNRNSLPTNNLTEHHLFAVTLPNKLYTWLKNVSISTMTKQLIHWHAAAYVFYEFYDLISTKYDALIEEEVNHIQKKYYSDELYYMFRNHDEDNWTKYKEYAEIARNKYLDVSNKFVGCAPPEFINDPIRPPDRSHPDDHEWGIIPHCTFSMLISYFTERDWLEIVSQDNKMTREFYKSKIGSSRTNEELKEIFANAKYDTLERAESDYELWEKWKHTFENYPQRNSNTFTLIADRADNRGYIYLHQTKSGSATKIGWTANESDQRLSGNQTGNHEKLVEVGKFLASSKKTEAVLHKLFEHKRARNGGEWYKLNKDDIENINDKKWRSSNNIF